VICREAKKAVDVIQEQVKTLDSRSRNPIQNGPDTESCRSLEQRQREPKVGDLPISIYSHGCKNQ
jgi:hypothetical protein